MANYIVLFFAAIFLVSCGTTKVVYSSSDKRTAKTIEKKSDKKSIKELVKLDATTRMKVYVLQYAELAQIEMKKFGIPASITLAQGLLESQAGIGELAAKSNNHFGIKCHSTWRGSSVTHDDDAKGECFRKYKKVEQSYRDHSEFLRYRDRYSDLFKLKKTDYVRWAHGLKKAGYATDLQYAYKLISLIERFELWKFDGSKEPIKTNTVKNQEKRSNYSYTVQQGDTLYSIAKKFDVSVDVLMNVNELDSTALAIGQQLKLK